MAEDAEISSLSYLCVSSRAESVLCCIANNYNSPELTEEGSLKKKKKFMKILEDFTAFSQYPFLRAI